MDKVKNYIKKEGIVKARGIRWRMIPMYLWMASCGDDKFDRPYYWAKVIVKDCKKPIKIKTKHKFKVGSTVGVEYDIDNSYRNAKSLHEGD